jgi:hypothetical protein
LNYRAYDGYFQDDELDNLSWAPQLPFADFATAFIKPTFDISNFRPVGSAYFALMGRGFGMDFPPYMTPILAIHLLNALLLYLLMRKLGIDPWRALAGAAFFLLSASALDAYGKPMYVFDLLCATFSLASILLFAYRRWILSFIAFWCAYKSKELAVFIPPVLLAYEYWFGEKERGPRRFAVLIPFFLASLSFGVQGLLFNPNKDNDYTFRFSLNALRATLPFYSQRFLFFPFSGFLLLLLALVRDRRVWFGLIAMLCFLFTLLFLPGRLFEAYTYLPLACATIALAAAATRLSPKWALVALLLWLPWNVRHQLRETRQKLADDDQTAAYVEQLDDWAAKHPDIRTYVYNGYPGAYHHWGITAAWNIAHHASGLRAYWFEWPDAVKALANEPVAYGTWRPATATLDIRIHSPGT